MNGVTALKQDEVGERRGHGLYRHANVAVDEKLLVSSLHMRPAFRPCYTPELLSDILDWQEGIKRRNLGGDLEPLRFGIFASAVPGFFNTGGDLSRFIGWIREQNRGELLAYATDCIRVAYNGSVALDLDNFEFIALVQGQALGGGFEAALACTTIVAEKGTQFGFPEVMFNLLPGMGAYAFLSRRVNPALAERMIMSGQLYSAEELYEMGIVSVLAEPGCGEEAVRQYIKQASRQRNARSLISNVRRKFNRVPYEELLDITQHWVECALGLSEKELKVMDRLVRAQNRQNVVTTSQAMGA